jgi:hypothetical protein
MKTHYLILPAVATLWLSTFCLAADPPGDAPSKADVDNRLGDWKLDDLEADDPDVRDELFQDRDVVDKFEAPAQRSFLEWVYVSLGLRYVFLLPLAA